MKKRDLEEVLRIQTDNNLSSWKYNDYVKELERDSSICKVAKLENNQVVGFAVVRILVGNDENNSAEIYNIAVDKSFQSIGIGQSLFDEVLRELRSKKVAEVWLEVRKSNSQAIKFYKKNRFSKQFVRKNYYQNPTEDAYIFKLSVD